MKITFTSPNASHHYKYAYHFDLHHHLYALISGWPRFSPKSRRLKLKAHVVREDLFQCMAMAFGRFFSSRDLFFALLNSALDDASFCHAAEADIFLYYRTTGVNTTKRIKRAGVKTICIMEEVNSHVLSAHHLVLEEYIKLGYSPCSFLYPYDVRKRLDAYQVSDFILCPSSFVKRSLEANGIPSEKIIVNSFGMPQISLPIIGAPRPNNEVFRVLYVGQINIRKGLRYLVEAFNLVAHPHKELVIVGPKTHCTGLDNTLFSDNIYFTGVLKGDQLSDQYLAATVFVLPSVEEGMALVIGEAMASGLPVVATTHTGAEDIMSHGKEGFIVEPCDSRALADALQTIIDTPGLRDQMSANCLAAASSILTWEESTANLISKFSLLLDR